MRYSIRDIFWLTLVVALALGWLIDRRNVRAALQRDLWEARTAFKAEIAKLQEWCKSKLPLANSPTGDDALTGRAIEEPALPPPESP